MATMTKTPKQVKPRKPAAPTTGTCGLVLRITAKSRTDRYTLSAVPADDPETFGVLRAFRLRKLGRPAGAALANLYDVVEHLDGSYSCDCADHCYAREGLQNGSCKHVSAVRRLQDAGIIARGRIR